MEAEKEVKVQQFVYRDATNVEREMYGCTGNNWSHWNSNEKLKEKFGSIPGKHSIDSLQKTAILGTSHVIRKVLQCDVWSLSGVDHCWFKRSTRKKCLWQETSISYNNNNAHNTERNTASNLKPEQKGSTLVQEKYQEGKSSDKRNNNNNRIQAKYLFLQPTKRVYRMKQKSVESSPKRW